jgi:glucose-6-phosphate 1-dehydrogenase
MTQETAVIVILGATGDLAKCKLVPALFNLAARTASPSHSP